MPQTSTDRIDLTIDPTDDEDDQPIAPKLKLGASDAAAEVVKCTNNKTAVTEAVLKQSPTGIPSMPGERQQQQGNRKRLEEQHGSPLHKKQRAGHMAAADTSKHRAGATAGTQPAEANAGVAAVSSQACIRTGAPAAGSKASAISGLAAASNKGSAGSGAAATVTVNTSKVGNALENPSRVQQQDSKSARHSKAKEVARVAPSEPTPVATQTAAAAAAAAGNAKAAGAPTAAPAATAIAGGAAAAHKHRGPDAPIKQSNGSTGVMPEGAKACANNVASQAKPEVYVIELLDSDDDIPAAQARAEAVVPKLAPRAPATALAAAAAAPAACGKQQPAAAGGAAAVSLRLATPVSQAAAAAIKPEVEPVSMTQVVQSVLPVQSAAAVQSSQQVPASGKHVITNSTLETAIPCRNAQQQQQQQEQQQRNLKRKAAGSDMEHGNKMDTVEAAQPQGAQPKSGTINGMQGQRQAAEADVLMEDAQGAAEVVAPAPAVQAPTAPVAAVGSDATGVELAIAAACESERLAAGGKKRCRSAVCRELANLAHPDFYDPFNPVQMPNAPVLQPCNDLTPPTVPLTAKQAPQQVSAVQLQDGVQQGSGKLEVPERVLRRDGSGSASSPAAATAPVNVAHQTSQADTKAVQAAAKGLDAVQLGERQDVELPPAAAVPAGAGHAPAGRVTAELTAKQQKLYELLKTACMGENQPLMVLGVFMSPTVAACYKLVHAHMLNWLQWKWSDKLLDPDCVDEVLQSVIEADEDTDGGEGTEGSDKCSPYVKALIKRLRSAASRALNIGTENVTAWDILKKLPAQIKVERGLIEYTVGDEDPREQLRGFKGIRTDRKLKEKRVLGAYNGFVVANSEYEAGRDYFGFQACPPARVLHNIIRALPDTQQMEIPGPEEFHPAVDVGKSGPNKVRLGLAFLYYMQYSAPDSLFDQLMKRLACVCSLHEEDAATQAIQKKAAGKKLPVPEPQPLIQAPVAAVRAALWELMVAQLCRRAEQGQLQEPSGLEHDEELLKDWLAWDEGCWAVECDAYGADLPLEHCSVPVLGSDTRKDSLLRHLRTLHEDQTKAQKKPKSKVNKKNSFTGAKLLEGADEWQQATSSQLALVEQQLHWFQTNKVLTVTALPPHRNSMAILNDPAHHLPEKGNTTKSLLYTKETAHANCAQKIFHLGGWPFPLMVTKRVIQEGEELSYSYDMQYWLALEKTQMTKFESHKYLALKLLDMFFRALIHLQAKPGMVPYPQVGHGPAAGAAAGEGGLLVQQASGSSGSQEGSGSAAAGESSKGTAAARPGAAAAGHLEPKAGQGSVVQDTDVLDGPGQDQEVISQQHDMGAAAAGLQGADLEAHQLSAHLPAAHPQLLTAVSSLPLSNGTQTTTTSGPGRRRSFFRKDARLAAALRSRPPTAPPALADPSYTPIPNTTLPISHPGFQAPTAPGMPGYAPAYHGATTPTLPAYSSQVPPAYTPSGGFNTPGTGPPPTAYGSMQQGTQPFSALSYEPGVQPAQAGGYMPAQLSVSPIPSDSSGGFLPHVASAGLPGASYGTPGAMASGIAATQVNPPSFAAWNPQALSAAPTVGMPSCPVLAPPAGSAPPPPMMHIPAGPA